MKLNSIEKWMQIKTIEKNGIIKLKNNSYIIILKIIPINFNLKSNFEKEAILNSYKLFLKTCNFNFQILIQSNKQSLKKYIKILKENINIENNKIKNIINKYCNELEEINNNNETSSKIFFIILKQDFDKRENNIAVEELENNYFKIKECLSRCGNLVYKISDKDELKKVLKNFYRKEKGENN